MQEEKINELFCDCSKELLTMFKQGKEYFNNTNCMYRLDEAGIPCLVSNDTCPGYWKSCGKTTKQGFRCIVRSDGILCSIISSRGKFNTRSIVRDYDLAINELNRAHFMSCYANIPFYRILSNITQYYNRMGNGKGSSFRDISISKLKAVKDLPNILACHHLKDIDLTPYFGKISSKFLSFMAISAVGSSERCLCSKYEKSNFCVERLLQVYERVGPKYGYNRRPGCYDNKLIYDDDFASVFNMTEDDWELIRSGNYIEDAKFHQEDNHLILTGTGHLTNNITSIKEVVSILIGCTILLGKKSEFNISTRFVELDEIIEKCKNYNIFPRITKLISDCKPNYKHATTELHIRGSVENVIDACIRRLSELSLQSLKKMVEDTF